MEFSSYLSFFNTKFIVSSNKMTQYTGPVSVIFLRLLCFVQESEDPWGHQWDTSAPELPLVPHWGTITWHQLAGQVSVWSHKEKIQQQQENIAEMLRDLSSERSIYES